MKSKSVVLMIVSLGFGLIAAIGISQVMGKSGPTEATVERGQVLVAAVDLKHGDDLTEETCKIEHWPMEVIPEGAVKSFDEIKHKKMTTRLSRSLPIMMTDTIDANKIDNIVIPKGYKAIAIKVSSEETMYGLLKPGDRVDVIGVVQVPARDGNRRTETVSETFLRNIEVFSVNGKLTSGGPREADGGGNAVVGLLVTEPQSELVVLVQKVAKLRLVLRGNLDNEDLNETGAEAITDINGFYESVFGTAKEEPEVSEEVVEAEPFDDGTSHNMRIWEGDTYSEVKFVGNKRVTPTETSSYQEEDDDFEDYDSSDEIESGLEEDQYPGE